MPTSTLTFIPAITDVPFVTLLWWLLALTTIAFAIHALIVIYHWFTYGTERSVPIISTIIYLGFGGLILLAMAITLATM